MEENLPALVCVIAKAPDGAVCDGVECGASAVVMISVDVWREPVLRCAECWPALDAMLLRRGHAVVDER